MGKPSLQDPEAIQIEIDWLVDQRALICHGTLKGDAVALALEKQIAMLTRRLAISRWLKAEAARNRDAFHFLDRRRKAG